jgi:hypothetical protein
LLYVYGISSLLRRVSAVLPLVVLGAIVVFVTASEILIKSRRLRERRQLVSPLTKKIGGLADRFCP